MADMRDRHDPGGPHERTGRRGHDREWRGHVVVALALGAGILFGACGDDADTSLDEARERVEDAAGAAGARATAEAVRGVLLARDLERSETLRDVAVLRDAVADLPGDPTVSGLHDGDGDGRDDDGRLEVGIGDQRACVEVADNGEVDVSGGSCGSA